MTHNKRQNLLREGAVLVLVIAAVAVSEYVFFQLWRLDWQVPMLYGGDGIYWVGQVQRSYGDLTPALGWPFYQPPSPYEPNYDLIYDAFVAFVGLFTQNTGIVFNLYVPGTRCSAWRGCGAGWPLHLRSRSGCAPMCSSAWPAT